MNDEVCNQDAECAQMRERAFTMGVNIVRLIRVRGKHGPTRIQ